MIPDRANMARVSLKCRELDGVSAECGYKVLPMLFRALAETLDKVSADGAMTLDQVVDVLNDVHYMESYRQASDIDARVAAGMDDMGPARLKLVGDCFAVAAEEVLGKEGGAL